MSGTNRRRKRMDQSFDETTEYAKCAVLDRRAQHDGLAWEIATWRDCEIAQGLPFRAWIMSVVQSTGKVITCEHDLVFNAGTHFIVVPNIKEVAYLEYESKENTPPVVKFLAHKR